jgi:hypothetical protein
MPRTPPSPAERLARARAAARKAMAWEALGPGLALAAAPPALVMVAGAWGLLEALSPMAASGVALGAWVVAAAIAVRTVLRRRRPTAAEIDARLEADAGLSELRPLTAAADPPAGGDPIALALWNRHRARLAEVAAGIAGPRDRRPLAQADRLWLRAAIPLALAAAVAMSPSQAPTRALAALGVDGSALAGDAPLRIEAWAEPPGYLKTPAVRLTGRAGSAVSVPAGSVIRVRVDGARGAPVLLTPGGRVALARRTGGTWLGSATLTRDGEVSVERFGRRAAWRVTLVADAPPTVVWTQAPSRGRGDRIDMIWSAEDDHGVVAQALELRLVAPPAMLEGAPPIVTPVTPDGAGQRAALDLVAHPWAGLEVDAALIVTDGAGQTGRTPPHRLVLPERDVSDPVARAILEQRRLILWARGPYGRAPAPGPRVTLSDAASVATGPAPIERAPAPLRRAEALMTATLETPDLLPDAASQLALATARARLRDAADVQEAAKVAPILWALAMRLERGPTGDAEAELQAARDALARALQRGASGDELAERMDRLREAVRKRLAELAQEAMARGEVEPDAGAEPQGGQALSDLLDALGAAATLGERGQAQALLDQLAQMMENAQVRLGQGEGDGMGVGSGTGDAGDSATAPLEQALGRQRELGEDTFRGDGAPGDLAQRQQALAGEVQRQAQATPRGGDEDGGDAAGAASDAAQAMQEAAGALQRGDREAAVEAQDRASAALRRAIDGLRRDQAQRAGTDPLGRLNGSGMVADPGEGAPATTDRARARAILDELRRRAQDPSRSEEERAYLERLLEPF